MFKHYVGRAMRLKMSIKEMSIKKYSVYRNDLIKKKKGSATCNIWGVGRQKGEEKKKKKEKEGSFNIPTCILINSNSTSPLFAMTDRYTN